MSGGVGTPRRLPELRSLGRNGAMPWRPKTISNLIFSGPLAWTAEAACHGQTRLFFAPAGRASRGPRRPRGARPAPSAAGAPCCTECREWAREHREYGFWGGESEEERAAAGFRVDMPVGRVARYPRGDGTARRTARSRIA